MRQCDFDENNVGIHSDDCPEYDGKRCKVIGFRPCRICEPWAIELVAQHQSAPKFGTIEWWQAVERASHEINEIRRGIEDIGKDIEVIRGMK